MEDVLDPGYWKERYRTLEGHKRVYKCDQNKWERVEEVHREILAELIPSTNPKQGILDIGCGWGRLLDLLPPWWDGKYLGIDLCREFVQEARRNHPLYPFIVGDALDVLSPFERDNEYKTYDLAVMISVIPMLERNVGTDYADRLLKRVKRCAKRVLLLEYDPFDSGTIIEGEDLD